MEFIKYLKTKRFTSNIIITEKIDGTNAQLVWDEDHQILRCGSRNRYLNYSYEPDNFGFAAWVDKNREVLTKYFKDFDYPIYGEWWGKGIQRGYEVDQKYFSIFHTGLFGDKIPQELYNIGVRYVPVLYEGLNVDDPIHTIYHQLFDQGSKLKYNYMNPEGICIFFKDTGTIFKMTYEYEKGKWNDK